MSAGSQARTRIGAGGPSLRSAGPPVESRLRALIGRLPGVIGPAVLLAGVAGCSTEALSTLPTENQPEVVVTVTPPVVSLPVGGTEQLTAVVTDGTGSVMAGASVAWASSDESTATVSSDGLLSAIAEGTASITATSGGESGSAAVTVSASVGDLEVSTSTSGSDLDPDGYTVTVGGSQSQPIGVSDNVTFSDLAAGDHSVQLSGVAGNCTVSGANPRTVTVPEGGTAQTTFDVSCAAASGSILVEEHFENTDFSSRGWYDLRNPQIVFDSDRGSNVLVMTFEAGNQSTTTALGRHLFEAQETVYLSFWVRYSANWVGSQTGPHPHEFFFMTDADHPYVGPAAAQLQVLIEQNHCVRTNGDNCPGSVTGMIPMIGANFRAMRASEVYFTDDPGPRYKNDWHHIEAQLTMNSGVDEPDGIARYWYDGQLIIEEVDVVYRAEPEDDGFLFNQFLLGPWMAGPGQNGSPITQTMWVDDIIISTERIGS